MKMIINIPNLKYEYQLYEDGKIINVDTRKEI